MILIVTANPLLETVYTTDEIQTFGTFRSGKTFYRAGGKGINISRQLKLLGVPSLNLFPIGGETGRIFRSVLESEELAVSPVSVKSAMRTAAVIESPANKLSYLANGSPLSSGEVSAMIDKLSKMIVNAEIVVFAGSVSCEAAAEIYTAGLKLAAQHDKISLLDTYGPHLKDCYALSPTIIHNNLDEIAGLADVRGDNESAGMFVKNLYSYGIKQAYLTNAGQRFYSSNFNYLYGVTPPHVTSIDSTGSGDAFNAGILYGWYHDLTYMQTLTLAVKLGALNSLSNQVCSVPQTQLEEFASEIEIVPVGDKLKVINDTATFH